MFKKLFYTQYAATVLAFQASVTINDSRYAATANLLETKRNVGEPTFRQACVT